MVMFLIMGMVIILSLCVIGGLFYFIKKDNVKNSSAEAVPITDVSEIKELSSQDSQDDGIPRHKAASFNPAVELPNEDLLAAKAKLADLEKSSATKDSIS